MEPPIEPKRPPVVHELFQQGEEDVSATSWRIFRIVAEFVSGFEILQKYGLAASIFGGARFSPDSAWFKESEKLGFLLAKSGFVVITGGGAGIMSAANKGAYEAGGHSVGLNIKLPHEQRLNGYVTDSETFHFFFTRKIMLSFASEVYIYFPGGFGTLDEFFELLTLVQTGKIAKIPIVLVGRAYWEPLAAWFRSELLEKERAIEAHDLDLFYIVDTAQEAHDLIMRLDGKHQKDTRKQVKTDTALEVELPESPQNV